MVVGTINALPRTMGGSEAETGTPAEKARVCAVFVLAWDKRVWVWQNTILEGDDDE